MPVPPCAQGGKARVLAALEELGGEKEVMADVEKRREFTTALGIESKMVLAAVSEYVGDMICSCSQQAGLTIMRHARMSRASCPQIESLAAEKNKGVHRLIKHADMRVFWYNIFLSTEKVSWDTWWEAFPEYLKDAQVDDKVVLQLDALLQTPEAKKAFQVRTKALIPCTRVLSTTTVLSHLVAGRHRKARLGAHQHP